MVAVCQKNYRAQFVACNDYASEIQGSYCVLPISVGQHYVEGARLQAFLDLVNCTFSRCDIIVIDLLQRHTLRLHQAFDDSACWGLAVSNGQQWLDRNHETLQTLQIPHRIRYWQEWLYDIAYIKQRQLIDHLYQSEPVIRSAFNQSADNFTKRYIARCPQLSGDAQRIFDICLQYVKEECSIMPLWVKEGYQFEVYPGKRIAGMQAVYELLVKPRHPDLLRWLQVNMRSVSMTPV